MYVFPRKKGLCGNWAQIQNNMQKTSSADPDEIALSDDDDDADDDDDTGGAGGAGTLLDCAGKGGDSNGGHPVEDPNEVDIDDSDDDDDLNN